MKKNKCVDFLGGFFFILLFVYLYYEIRDIFSFLNSKGIGRELLSDPAYWFEHFIVIGFLALFGFGLVLRWRWVPVTLIVISVAGLVLPFIGPYFIFFVLFFGVFFYVPSVKKDFQTAKK